MPRGMSTCRFCGKAVPSMYRRFHEERQCKVMRRRRGDFVKPDDPEKREPRGLDRFLEKTINSPEDSVKDAE